jgi:putative nucleotidyltransferase with HDIG domain
VTNLPTLPLTPLIDRLRPILSAESQPVYLVGGTVRDALLGRPIHDIDLVVANGAISLTFRMANALSLPAYVLDKERDVGRIIFPNEDLTLDIARFRGPTLEDDLRGRDFTINAMALPIEGQTTGDIIDIYNGREDLAARRLQRVHEDSLADDPVRALRAARFAAQLDFALTAETATAARAVAPQLPSRTSPERLRDELSRLLTTGAPHVGMALLQELEILEYVLPELSALDNVVQSPPHHEDVFRHTLSVLRFLVEIDKLIMNEGDSPAEAWAAAVETLLSPYRGRLQEHLAVPIDGGVPARSLLMWGGLLHDIGKAVTQTTTPDGRVRFLGHDEKGATMAGKLLSSLSFSNEARQRGRRIVEGHMRPLLLANDRHAPSRRAIYRYFRALGPAGLDVALLAIADHFATYAGRYDQESWEPLRIVLESLIDTYFNGYEQTIAPPRLLNGQAIMDELGTPPGHEIGRLLRALEEAQASGDVTTRDEALTFIRRHHMSQ